MSASSLHADDLLYRYEGTVVPSDPSEGWIVADACDAPCAELVTDGRLELSWVFPGNTVNYHRWVAQAGEVAPSTFWVEWQFRSNHTMGPYDIECDGRLSIRYLGIGRPVYMYGDAVISGNLSDYVLGLDVNEFHTLRFESVDGVHYTLSVDGGVFSARSSNQPTGNGYVQFSGDGGCDYNVPTIVNEWDYIRYGTISYGEQAVASDPPQGFVDARRYADVDCFAVTFDSANYVYVDEISVEIIPLPSGTSGTAAPAVVATRRGEESETAVINGIVVKRNAPDTVEIVLDRPMPMGATTRFTINDGVATNVIEYTFAPGDTDGDDRVTLHDLYYFQNCFGLNLDGASAGATPLDPPLPRGEASAMRHPRGPVAGAPGSDSATPSPRPSPWEGEGVSSAVGPDVPLGACRALDLDGTGVVTTADFYFLYPLFTGP